MFRVRTPVAAASFAIAPTALWSPSRYTAGGRKKAGSGAGTGTPLPYCTFEAFGPTWTDAQWRTAKASVDCLPDKSDKTCLDICVKYRRENLFLVSYKLCIDELVGAYTTAESCFLHCVTKAERHAIRLSWWDGEQASSCFVASAKALSTFTHRNVFAAPWTLEPLHPSNGTEALLLDALSSDQVYVVSGESGSGKTTWALMTSRVGVYVISGDLDDGLRMLNSMNGADQTKRRDKLVVTLITKAVASALGKMFAREAQLVGSAPLTVSIVMDEFGSYPGFVRALCSARGYVRRSLAKLFKFDVHIQLIVVGTGTDAQATRSGSLPSSFVAARMPTAAPMLELLKTSLSAKFQTAADVLLEALDAHTQAAHLVQNPRLAALLFKRILEFHRSPYGSFNKLYPTTQAALTSLDAHLLQAARDYRNLNAMSDVDEDGVQDAYALALALTYRDPVDAVPLTAHEMGLFTRKGVLTDRAFWQLAGDSVPAGCIKIASDTVAVTEDGVAANCDLSLVSPKEGRFEMSMAQQRLFRMSYGFGVLETAASWQRPEVVTAEYVSVVLAAHKGRKLRKLMERLGMPTSASSSTNAALLDTVLRYDSVAVVHMTKRIRPEIKKHNATTYKIIAGLERTYTSKGTALVLVNGAGAQYADVIAIVPGVAVILIQCKVCAPSTPLANIVQEAAILKTQIPALNRVAQLPGARKPEVDDSRYLRVLVTNKALHASEVPKDLCYLNTSDPAALAPLFAPVSKCATPEGDFTEVRVIQPLAPLWGRKGR
jgi:hypothetical protein